MKTSTYFKLLICEASPIVGNLAIAVYASERGCGDVYGPVLGTFGDRAEARAFCVEFNEVVVYMGGTAVPIEEV